jgi:hypothetical protein
MWWRPRYLTPASRAASVGIGRANWKRDKRDYDRRALVGGTMPFIRR